jgi:thiosulfate/3-mercaptopyruvate sulfurtransferase
MNRYCSIVAVATLMAAGGVSLAGDSIGPAPFRIVSPDWVAERVDDASVRILDVRTSIAAYQTAHIPGAVFLANDALRAPLNGVPVQFLDPEEMASLFRRAGIGPEHTVVVYAEDGEVLGSSMAAYALHRIGHRNVAILDGGIERYRTEHPLTQTYPSHMTGTLSPQLDRSVLATFEDVKAAMKNPDVLLIDARPLNEYVGDTSRWIRNGHIPGSVSLHWRHLMQGHSAHAFKSVDEMRELVEATGAKKDQEIIVYCGTGREATLLYGVMKHTLGYPNVRLYEGSWTEYAAKEDMPVQTRPGRVVAPEPAGDRGASSPRRQSQRGSNELPRTLTLTPHDCGSIVRLHTIDGIFMASQPARNDFLLAAEQGIRTVFNQRHDHEVTYFDPKQVVESSGMRYIQIAWNGPEELTDEIIEKSRTALREAERPLLFYCRTGNRTGAIWLAYSVLDRGLSWEDALAEATTVGLRTPAYREIIQDYVERQTAAR